MQNSIELFGKNFKSRQVDCGDVVIECKVAGDGPPLLLLHGYPQTHAMWHLTAPTLATRYTVICADLRGYGDSSKPVSDANHEPYSKRAMARDMVTLMENLGYPTFKLAGHDRGARVCHRLMLDYPDQVLQACVMDIVPTLHMFDHTDQSFATGYYHWFFLAQPHGLPERMIGADPEYYLRMKMASWSADGTMFDERAMMEYIRCFSKPETIHGSCEDYRAAAGIDLVHDRQTRSQLIDCPLLVLWGNRGFVHKTYDVLDVWRGYGSDIRGHDLECGHYLPEEAPSAVTEALFEFFH
jgi:haloacetate dehalogenase